MKWGSMCEDHDIATYVSAISSKEYKRQDCGFSKMTRTASGSEFLQMALWMAKL